jgi:uncharacterized protein (TIGR04255 family)
MKDKMTVAAMPLHFKNPPIVEAVIAFEIPLLPPDVIADFQAGSSLMQEIGYLLSGPVTKHQVEIRVEGASASFGQKESSPHGLRFGSIDELYAVQFNRDGFVFSRIERYDTWEVFRAECRRVWEIYSRISGVTDVSSYAVRYINKLYIPLEEDSEQYVNIFPKLPAGIPNLISESFMRLGLPIDSPKGKLLHQQILLPPERDGFSALLLDNLFQFPAIGLTQKEIWAQLEEVRQVKDFYFDQFVSKKMKDTFNV